MATFIDTRTVDSANQEICHFIPCEIQYDGNANINTFFATTISGCEKKDTSNELTATFRGRPLNGQELNVPSGYTGLVVNEPHKRVTEDLDRQLVVNNTFKKFTHWNLDRQPSQDDLVQRAFQWVDIASVIHTPVTEDQEESK